MLAISQDIRQLIKGLDWNQLHNIKRRQKHRCKRGRIREGKDNNG